MRLQFLFILFLLSVSSYGQTKIFDGHNFQTGNYSLVFLDVALIEEEEVIVEEYNEIQPTNKPTEYVDHRLHFIIDEKHDLERIQNTWEGKPVDYQHMCWYNYFIYLLEDGIVKSEMRANFECKELLVDKVPYEFDSTLITSIIPEAEKIYKIEVTYKSIDKARSYYLQNIENSDLLMIEHYRPNWVDFSGLFEVKFLDYEKTGNVEERISNLLRESGLEHFKLSWAASGIGIKDEPNDYWYRVFSNEQPESLNGLQLRKEWLKFNTPFKATYIKRNTPNIQ